MLSVLTIGLLVQVATAPITPTEYGNKFGPVSGVSDAMFICEAEEFASDGKGWQSKPWGTNYYCATFANSFLSRKAYLGAPETGERTVATRQVQIAKPAKYLALARYEACYRFETQFRLQVEQNGKVLLDRLYGARNNDKIWAFRQMLKKEVGWPWGAVENLVWEGHDAAVKLTAGPATLRLIADPQTGDAARRNVDCIVLTSDEEQIKTRIEKENYLPLDGLLTQAGDVFVKVANAGSDAVTVTIPPCTEHSPYWIHMRSWVAKTIALEPGQSGGWEEVGSLLDTLNDGQWNITAKTKTAGGPIKVRLEFALKSPQGTIEPITAFEMNKESLTLAYDADTRYTRRIRNADDVLYELITHLKQQQVHGQAPRQTLIFGMTFTERLPPRDAGDEKYNAAIREFKQLMGATALNSGGGEIPTDGGLVRGYIDVRGVPTPKLEEYCQKLKAEGKADKVAVVSLGDEIGLPLPPATDHAAFRTWCQSRSLKPNDVDPAATTWDAIQYNIAPETAKSKPGVYYWSKIYGYRYGIAQLKERTDILKRYLPNAGVGANFSPHHGHHYLGPTHQWISLFREGGMTMPWGEDYIWQVPVGSQQMNFIMVDMFRAAIRGKPDAKIHYYVMPHTPGNTPDNWRRQFYGDIAHGVKVFNLFEFRPVQAAYTENHCSDPAMYREVRKAFHELGTFEDIVQSGQVRPAKTAIWFSEAADVWDDYKPPFAAGKRSLYLMLRQRNEPLDFVVEGDDLGEYEVIYLTDLHVSQAGTKQLIDWVRKGGTLFITAGGGMYDELNRTNDGFNAVLGIKSSYLQIDEENTIRLEKQDLPFAKSLRAVDYPSGPGSLRAFGAITWMMSEQNLSSTLDVLYRQFDVGRGKVNYSTVLPGLAYLHRMLPRRPVDRGADSKSSSHFNPINEFPRATIFGTDARRRPTWSPPTADIPGVELSEIESDKGLLVPVINWESASTEAVKIRVFRKPGSKMSLASGTPLKVEVGEGYLDFFFLLEVADAIIIRP